MKKVGMCCIWITKRNKSKSFYIHDNSFKVACKMKYISGRGRREIEEKLWQGVNSLSILNTGHGGRI
jgi:hypothetical protein